MDVRDVLDGSAHPTGSVLVLDELGFHHATSVAEVLADRGCEVEVVSPGMVVGQDLGITLDLENWWIRAGAKGITQSTELVPMGVDGHTLDAAAPPDGPDRHPRPRTGSCWPCPPPRPRRCTTTCAAAGVEVERVGDAVAPRRAHAAVIDGERVGAALPAADRALAVTPA